MCNETFNSDNLHGFPVNILLFSLNKIVHVTLANTVAKLITASFTLIYKYSKISICC
jgi:hypothetical protein